MSEKAVRMALYVTWRIAYRLQRLFLDIYVWAFPQANHLGVFHLDLPRGWYIEGMNTKPESANPQGSQAINQARDLIPPGTPGSATWDTHTIKIEILKDGKWVEVPHDAKLSKLMELADAI